jgi:hypothetical protein
VDRRTLYRMLARYGLAAAAADAEEGAGDPARHPMDPIEEN